MAFAFITFDFALSALITGAAAEMLEVAAWIGRLDALAALASLASGQHWVRPSLRDQPGIEIVGGRHPLVVAVPTATDVALSESDRV